MESEFVESVEEVGTVRIVNSPEIVSAYDLLGLIPDAMGEALLAWVARRALAERKTKLFLPAGRERLVRSVYQEGELLLDAEFDGLVGGVLIRPVGSRYEVSTHT